MIIIPTNINSRILTAPVLIPNTPDCTYNQGEPVLSEEKVRRLATSFNDYGIIDYEHQFNKKNTDGYQKQVGSVIDSWLIPEEETIKGLDGVTRTYPKGTWFLSTRITDPNVIREFDTGKIKGFSSTTVNKQFADSIATKSKTLIKDIKNPVVMTVSVTASPCVGDAKFCKVAYKHEHINEKDNMDNETVFKKIGNFFLNLNEEGEEVTADKSEKPEEEVKKVEEQEQKPEEEKTKEPEEKKEKVEEDSANKADDTTSEDKPQDNKDNGSFSSDDFKALQDRVSALEKQVQTLLNKSSNDNESNDTQQEDNPSQKTANKSKQLDVPDINSTHTGSISSTNAVYKAMGRTRFGRRKQ